MPQTDACFFSPFSPSLVKHPHSKCLLLLFFFKEILAAHQALFTKAPHNTLITSFKRHFPYSWTYEIGHINKAHEHIQLLLIAFEEAGQPFQAIESILASLLFQFLNKTHLKPVEITNLKRKLRQVYLLAEPLIHLNKYDENLIFFLLKNKEAIDSLLGDGHLFDFFSSLYKKKLKAIEKRLCDQLHQRGFFAQIPEFKQAFARLRK